METRKVFDCLVCQGKQVFDRLVCQGKTIGYLIISLVLTLPTDLHAQLSGNGDQLLVVGVSNLRGDPAANFGGAGIKTGDLNCDGRDEVIVMQRSAVKVSASITTLTMPASKQRWTSSHGSRKKKHKHVGRNWAVTPATPRC